MGLPPGRRRASEVTKDDIRRALFLARGDEAMAAKMLSPENVRHSPQEYEVVEIIKDGKEGTIKRVKAQGGDQEFVMKLFKRTPARNVKEIYFTVRASDLGVGPHVYNFGVSGPDATHFVVTELLQTTLEDLGKTGGLTADIVWQTAKTAKNLLDAGIRHGDVHTGNVMVGADNKVYWVDWGYSVEQETQTPLNTLSEDIYDLFGDFPYATGGSEVGSYADAVAIAQEAVPGMPKFL